jgi:hypothetical protein
MWTCRIVASVIIGIAGVLFYMATDRDPPFQRGPGRIFPVNPLPGSAVEVEWEGKRIRDCDGYVYRKIIDSHGVVFSIEGVPVTYFKTRNPDPLVRYFRLPVGAAPGPAKYIATTHYYCNPLHRWWPIVVETPQIDFNLAEGVPLQGPRGLQGEQGVQGERGERGEKGQ